MKKHKTPREKAITYIMRTIGRPVMQKYYEKAIDIAIQEREKEMLKVIQEVISLYAINESFSPYKLIKLIENRIIGKK